VIIITENPLVSVLTPVHNSEDFLKESIESILEQNYDNFEFIIVDDHSTDSSWEIIKEYEAEEEKIKAFRNKKNLDIPKTRNKAFNEAEGKYYAIHDSDDISMPNRLKKQVKFLENNKEYGLVGCQMEVIDENSETIGKRNYPTSFKKIKKIITRYDPIPQPGAMIRASVIEDEIGYYNEKYTRAQDYDLWLRIASKYKIKNLDETLVKYRRHESQGLEKNFKKNLKFTLEIQRKWLLHKDFFSFSNWFIWLFKHIPLVLPKSLSIKLLNWLYYN